MITRTFCSLLITTAAAVAQEPLSDYLDTAFGWLPGAMPESTVPASLRQGMSPEQQLARRHVGVPTSAPLLEQSRRRSAGTDDARSWGRWQFFPSSAPHFMPYLDSVFVPGNTCAEPCAFVTDDAISTSAQKVKKMLSLIGLQYGAVATYNYARVVPSIHGKRNNFSAFNFQAAGKWFLAKTRDNAHSLFLSFEADLGLGVNFSERSGGVQNSLGTLSQPQSSLRGGSGVFLPELALGLSLFDGKWVGMVGTLDASNYLDQNAYAASWHGNLTNSAFGSNPCLPLEWGNWGYMTALQPTENFYVMYATTGCNGGINQNPFNNIDSDYWVHVGELGWIVDDVLGMGPGTYRLQYSVTCNDGASGDGVACNIQQQLGRQSRLGFFTRCGYMDNDASSVTGVRAAATAGLVLQAPFTSSGWGSKSNNDQVGFGFLWQRAAGSERPYAHKDEYGLELTAVVQLTPTFYLQPDIQYIFNPVHAESRDHAVVFQLQGVFAF